MESEQIPKIDRMETIYPKIREKQEEK